MYTEAKPTDSKESLLNDIRSAANQSHMPSLALRPHAALIVKVADEIADTIADLKTHITNLNKQNAKLQCWVVALAVAALIGTVVQTCAAIYPFLVPSQSAMPTAPVNIGRAPPPQPLLPAAQPKEHLAPPPASSGTSKSAKTRSSPSSAAATPNLKP